MNRELELEICGQRLKIRTDEDDAYMRDLAAYVEQHMVAVGHGRAGTTTLNVALLALLRIADELYKMKADADETEQTIASLADRIEQALAESA